MPSGTPAAKPALATTLGSVKNRVIIHKRKYEFARGLQKRAAWRRMVIELSSSLGTKKRTTPLGRGFSQIVAPRRASRVSPAITMVQLRLSTAHSEGLPCGTRRTRVQFAAQGNSQCGTYAMRPKAFPFQLTKRSCRDFVAQGLAEDV